MFKKMIETCLKNDLYTVYTLYKRTYNYFNFKLYYASYYNKLNDFIF